MRLRSVLILAAVLFHGLLHAQSFPYTSYSVKDGLPHANVYAIAQDSLGYMWFGTENGLTRFDGTDFVRFFEEPGPLASGVVTALLVTPGPVLYAGTNDNQVFRIDHQNITSLHHDQRPVIAVSSIGVQQGHVLLFHEFFYTEVIPDVTDVKQKRTSRPAIPKNDAPLCSKMIRDGSILIGRHDGLFRVEKGVLTKFAAEFYNDEAIYTIFEDQNGDLYLGAPGKIFKVRNWKVVEIVAVNLRTEQNIKVLLRDNCGNFWLSFWGDDNLYILTPDKTLFNLFENSGIRKGIVSRIFKDAAGDVWLSILGNGIYRFSNLFLKNNTAGDLSQGSFLTCMDVSMDDYIVFGTYNGLLFHHRESNKFYHTKLSPGLLEYVRDIRVDGKQVYAGITDMRLEALGVKEQQLIAGSDTFMIHYKHASSIRRSGENLLLGNWDNEIALEGNQKKNVSEALIYIYKNLESLRINCIYQDNDQRLYVGTQLGLVIIGLKNNIKYTMRTGVLSGSVNRIVPGKDADELIIYTDHGVCMMSNGVIVSSLRNSSVNRITAIRELNNGSRFVGTLNGLYYFSKEDSVHFNIRSGLPANQVNDLYFDEKYQQLVVITNSGFSQINARVLGNYSVPRPQVLASSIETASRKIHFSGSAELPYTERLKLLNFSSLNDPGNYRYVRVTTGDGHSFHAASNKFDLSELSPGLNRLKVCYVFDDGSTGPETEVEITLVPPFYRTAWFYLLAGLSGTGLTFLGFRKRRHVVDQKKHERQQVDYKINMLKQQALVSNLNPHFIFNALNAIQDYVNSSNMKDANEYLALFSKLMRQHLNSAGRDLIPVEEETERLKNYLDIEKMRFGDHLEYGIVLGERIQNLDVAIPNMIIQPFIENSIWHGFKGMTERGRITLKMELEADDMLVIRIEDNGRGIGNVVPGKESRGISLIRERLELMSGTKDGILFFDALNPDHVFPGTVVTIRLSPIMYRVSS
jgi:ligand-binding sensor domain-containing protein